MPKFIRDRKLVVQVGYERRFTWCHDRGAGFSFECDEQSNITRELKPAGQENLEKCLDGTYNVIDEGVIRWEYSYWEPAAIRCLCGAEVELHDPFLSTCDRCGRDYNGGGQLLAPRSQWGEETGESLADIFNSYDPEELF